MQKLYCYVDESGQDTKGQIFVVAVVVTNAEREHLLRLCEQIEAVSGKGKDKWGRAKHERRMRYLYHIFADDRFRKVLRYCTFRGTRDFDNAVVVAVANSVRWESPSGKYTTQVYVDGLTKIKRHEYGASLRRQGLYVREIRGIMRDESNALIRLADAIAGFVRDALTEKSEEVQEMFEKAKRNEMLVEVTT